MKKRIASAALVAVLLLPFPALGLEECAAGLIHIAPRCFTPAELAVFAPTPPQTVVSRPVYVAGVEQWRPMVAYYWAKHGATDRMLRIMRCESLGDPWARNPRSGAAGLFQIMPFWKRVWPGNYYDPWTNAAVAYQIWLSQGYAAWVCR